MKSVDVIIPCYNYARFLSQCVTSVLDQVDVEVRILIIDDCSSDETEIVGRQLSEQDSRVEFRRHKNNIGHIATYNEGLDWTNGDYVLLISADDLLTPGSLARTAKLMSAHPEVGLVYGRDIIFETTPLPSYVGPSTSECNWRIVTYRDFLEESCKLGHTPIQAPTVLARTALHKKIGGYKKELPHTADTEIWLRLAANSAVGVVDAEQAYRRVHHQSMSFLYSSPQRIWEQKRAFDFHFQCCAHRIEDVARMSRLLTHGLAEKSLWSASLAFDHGDADMCNEFIQLAFNLDSSVKNWPIMNHLRIKKFFGSKIWSFAQEPLSKLRKIIGYWSDRCLRVK